MEEKEDFPIIPPWLSKTLGWIWTIIKWLGALACVAGIVLLIILTGQAKKAPPKPKVNATIIQYDGGEEVKRWVTEDGFSYIDSAPGLLRFTDKTTGDKVYVHGSYTVIVPKKKKEK